MDKTELSPADKDRAERLAFQKYSAIWLEFSARASTCINDDESNNTNTPSYREFERVKRCNPDGADTVVPSLSASDARVLAKLYAKPKTPVTSGESTPSANLKASASQQR